MLNTVSRVFEHVHYSQKILSELNKGLDELLPIPARQRHLDIRVVEASSVLDPVVSELIELLDCQV